MITNPQNLTLTKEEHNAMINVVRTFVLDTITTISIEEDDQFGTDKGNRSFANNSKNP